jgi:hypothetical protein
MCLTGDKMKMEQFRILYKELTIKEIELLELKGKEYSGEDNTLLNFETCATKLNIHPIKVLMIFYSKHNDSIFSYSKDLKVYSNEDITSRIMDARNYLAILYVMVDRYRNLDEKHIWHII